MEKMARVVNRIWLHQLSVSVAQLHQFESADSFRINQKKQCHYFIELLLKVQCGFKISLIVDKQIIVIFLFLSIKSKVFVKQIFVPHNLVFL